MDLTSSRIIRPLRKKTSTHVMKHLRARTHAAVGVPLLVSMTLFLLLTTTAIAPIASGQASTTASGESTTSANQMIFAGEFAAGSYYAPTKYNQAALQADLNFLYSLGVNAIRFEPDYGFWVNNNTSATTELQNAIANVKQNGKAVVLADISSQSYFQHPIPWADFKAEWPTWVQLLAKTFQPDYYVVIKEPGWYVAMVSDATTNPDFQNATTWDTLAGTLADAVHSVSPNTKVAVSVAAADISKYPDFYNPFLSHLPASVPIIGFDIYGPGGQSNTQNYLSTYGSGGKEVWIQATWSQTASTAFDSTNSQSDVTWMYSIYHFAQSIHATMICPFFSNIFASYSRPPSNSSGLISMYQNRTPVYYAYQSVISGSPFTSSSTTGATSTGETTTRRSTGSHAGNRIPVSDLIAGFAALALVAAGIVAVALATRRRKSGNPDGKRVHELAHSLK